MLRGIATVNLWADDLAASLDRLVSLGAKQLEALTYLDILGSRG
jgi:hypothetical protein